MQSLRSTVATRAPFTSASTSRVAVVVRVKPTKAADYRALSEAELIEGVVGLKRQMAKLQYLKRTRGKVQNPETLMDQNEDTLEAPKGHEFKHVRRQMAQMLTVLRQRQIEDGIDRKTSRKLVKEVAVAAGMGGL